jgi:hypothetical protein
MPYRAVSVTDDKHDTAGQRVVDRVPYQCPQHAGRQNRMTESCTETRSNAKRDPFQPCCFRELRREIPENGTQWHPNMEVGARSFTQPQSLDELAWHAGQLRGCRSGTASTRRAIALSAIIQVTKQRREFMFVERTRYSHCSTRIHAFADGDSMRRPREFGSRDPHLRIG